MSEDKQATAVETVQMLDSRVVNFTSRTKVIKTTLDDGRVRFDFRNGETRYFDLNAEGVDLKRLAAHGAESKIGDSYSGLTSVEDCIEAVEDVTARLYRGEWNAGRGTGESYAGASILARALAEVRGKPLQVVREWLSTKSHKEKAALRRSELLVPTIEKMEAAARAKNAGKKPEVDVAGALSELDDL